MRSNLLFCHFRPKLQPLNCAEYLPAFCSLWQILAAVARALMICHVTIISPSVQSSHQPLLPTIVYSLIYQWNKWRISLPWWFSFIPLPSGVSAFHCVFFFCFFSVACLLSDETLNLCCLLLDAGFCFSSLAPYLSPSSGRSEHRVNPHGFTQPGYYTSGLSDY